MDSVEIAAWIALGLNCFYTTLMVLWIFRVRGKIRPDNPGMMKRRPSMLYLFLISATFAVGIERNLQLLNRVLTGESSHLHWLDAYTWGFSSQLVLWTYMFKAWFLYYDQRFHSIGSTKLTRSDAKNTFQNSFWGRNYKTFGTFRGIFKILLVPWICCGITLGTLAIIYGWLGRQYSLTNSALIAVPILCVVILSRLMMSHDDLWFMRRELSHSNKTALICLLIYVAIVILFDDETATFIAYTIDYSTCLFLLAYWSAVWSVKKTTQQKQQAFMRVELYNSDVNENKNNKQDNEENEEIPDSVVALPAVLKNLTTFGFFMQHCSKEFNTENLLYFCDCIHLIQLIGRNEHSKMQGEKKEERKQKRKKERKQHKLKKQRSRDNIIKSSKDNESGQNNKIEDKTKDEAGDIINSNLTVPQLPNQHSSTSQSVSSDDDGDEEDNNEEIEKGGSADVVDAPDGNDGNDGNDAPLPYQMSKQTSKHRKQQVTLAMTHEDDDHELSDDNENENEREHTYTNTRTVPSDLDSNEFREMNPMLYMALHAITRNDEFETMQSQVSDVIRPDSPSFHRQHSNDHKFPIKSTLVANQASVTEYDNNDNNDNNVIVDIPSQVSPNLQRQITPADGINDYNNAENIEQAGTEAGTQVSAQAGQAGQAGQVGQVGQSKAEDRAGASKTKATGVAGRGRSQSRQRHRTRSRATSRGHGSEHERPQWLVTLPVTALSPELERKQSRKDKFSPILYVVERYIGRDALYSVNISQASKLTILQWIADMKQQGKDINEDVTVEVFIKVFGPSLDDVFTNLRDAFVRFLSTDLFIEAKRVIGEERRKRNKAKTKKVAKLKKMASQRLERLITPKKKDDGSGDEQQTDNENGNGNETENENGNGNGNDGAPLPMVGLTLTNSSSHSQGGTTQLLQANGGVNEVIAQPSNDNTPRAVNEVGVVRVTSLSVSSKNQNTDEVAL